MIKARVTKVEALSKVFESVTDEQDFYEKFTELANSRSEETKNLLKNAGNYRRIWHEADKMFQSENSTCEIIETWFSKNLDKPALATCDPSGYRYRISERYDSRYGFKYPGDFLTAYNWYIEQC